VFGAPTYVCDELFLWGQDRLFFLDKYLGGQPVQSGTVKTIAKTRAR
jgi:hypothetical protein